MTSSIVSHHQRKPGKRGKVTGWSAGAARRNTAFLRSVDETQLDGFGLAITLTLKDCPPSADAWGRMVKAWLDRMARAGACRIHWVMEFQRRGVPHLHAAVWFPNARDHGTSIALTLHSMQWLDLASKYGASERGQHCRPITGIVGWFEYMSKHCSRSKKHYQRQRESMPDAWRTSGRVWGKRGDWPTIEPLKVDLSGTEGFWRWRRLMKSWLISEARAGLPLNRRQLAYRRRMLKTPDQKLSAVRPISEWIPQNVSAELIRTLDPA